MTTQAQAFLLPHATRAATQAALAAAGLLTLLCSIVLASGVSQQTFERVMAPEDYARALIAQADGLRLLVAIDDVFIVAYVASTVLLCSALAARGARAIPGLVVAATLLAALLDLSENHHILAMLRQAELGLIPSSAAINAQAVASSLKWMLGHLSFALLALALDLPGQLGRLLRGSLLGVQLPLGAATLVVVQPFWLELFTWARYGCMLSGFLAVAWLTRGAGSRSYAFDAAGSGAPA